MPPRGPSPSLFPSRRSSDLEPVYLLGGSGGGCERLLGGHPLGAWGEFEHGQRDAIIDRKSTRLNSSHVAISYAVFRLKKKIGDGADAGVLESSDPGGRRGCG